MQLLEKIFSIPKKSSLQGMPAGSFLVEIEELYELKTTIKKMKLA